MSSILANNGLNYSLISYWKLDGNAIDSTGRNNGVGTNISYISGKINQGASFNSSGGINTQFNNLPSVVTDISIAFWANPTSVGDAIVRAEVDDITNRLNIHLVYVDNICYWDFGSTSGGGRLSFNTGGLWNNILAHYVFTVEAGVGMKIFRNGLLITSNSTTNTFNITGKNLNLGLGFVGLLDEVGIWDRALSSNEVRNLYNNGIGSQFPFKESSKIIECGRLNPNLNNNLLGYWKLDGNSKNEVDAQLGIDNDVVYGPGKIHSGATFNGSSSYCDLGLGNTLQSASAFSVSCWVKPTTLKDLAPWITKWDYNPPNVLGSFSLSQSQLSSGPMGNIFFFICRNINDAGGNAVQSTNPISPGVWTHLVAVYDGTQATDQTRAKIYINGILQNTVVFGTIPPTTTASNSTLKLARYGLNSFPTYNPTQVDEVGFWGRALTAQEVQQLYVGGLGTSIPFKS